MQHFAGEEEKSSGVFLCLAPEWNLREAECLTRQLQLSAYSTKTIKSYCSQVGRFLHHVGAHSAIDEKTLQNYSNFLFNRKLSHAYVG
ncbi:MAG TPA: phage integrase N-terminal SAM-like domain-containing protein [Bacilli bacterium]